jgi:copper chaperone CopZ
MTRTVNIEGMHCGACAGKLERAFSRVPGVTGARVSLSPPAATLETSRPVQLKDLEAAARGAGSYSVSELADAETTVAAGATGEKPASVYPLLMIVAYILGSTLLTTYVRGGGAGGLHALMNDFMAGFFLVFSFFKLLDLRGFADTYGTYDLLAARWRAWGFVYPFVEVGLGVAYLIRWEPVVTSAVTLVLMAVGTAGVLRTLARGGGVRCACLGTALNLPMTWVTLTEDLVMAAMAAGMILWRSWPA